MPGDCQGTKKSDVSDILIKKQYEDLISYFRDRLNVINTSIYLMESKLSEGKGDVTKYFQKINNEIESIRKLINQ